jgi:hypothetical protein
VRARQKLIGNLREPDDRAGDELRNIDTNAAKLMMFLMA